jgi:hypothetical protein
MAYASLGENIRGVQEESVEEGMRLGNPDELLRKWAKRLWIPFILALAVFSLASSRSRDGAIIFPIIALVALIFISVCAIAAYGLLGISRSRWFLYGGTLEQKLADQFHLSGIATVILALHPLVFGGIYYLVFSMSRSKAIRCGLAAPVLPSWFGALLAISFHFLGVGSVLWFIGSRLKRRINTEENTEAPDDNPKGTRDGTR